jgi:hypothetical protein
MRLALLFLLGTSIDAAPRIVYSSAKSGPNLGWAGSATQGAAITLWGTGFGIMRGTSFVTLAGVNLTSDASYAEWGATTDPKTAKGFQRITFWLNSGMPQGLTTISVTVGGTSSNALPFTIDNTGGIRFIDETNGDDSWDGEYPDHSLGATHGPWKTVFLYSLRDGTTVGTFFYMRGGTYQNIFDLSSGHPSLVYIGYFEQSGATCAKAGDLTPCGCTIFYPTIDGTDALRYTVTSYPGEVATWQDTEIFIKSSYWTLANFRLSGTEAGGASISMGDEWSMCTTCQRHSVGLNVVGLEFSGYMHHAIEDAYGDNFQIVANYANVHPIEGGGYDNTTSYPFYLSSGDNRLVADNEIHGGSMYSIHNYDEGRCEDNGGVSVNRRMLNQTFDSNWFDETQDSVTPVEIRAGILTGTHLDQTDGNTYTNTTIRNNVFFSRDGNASAGAIMLYSEGTATYNGVHVYNNTFAGPFPYGTYVVYDSTSTWKNVDFTNNIYANIGQYEWYTDGGEAVSINPTLDHNLMAQAPRINGSGSASNTVVGSPFFTNAANQDFHLQARSPAITAGARISSVIRDYDDNARPASGGYSIGAFEYQPVPGTPPSITTMSPLPSGMENVPYMTTLAATGNTPITWIATNVPNGLSMSSGGVLSGTPTAAGTFTINVTAISAAGEAGPIGFSLTINLRRHRPGRPSQGQIDGAISR